MTFKVALGASSGGRLKRLFGPRVRRPCIVSGRRVFAIGDIHGRNDLLELMLDKIRDNAAANPARNALIFLGDYIDRGPDSRAVVQNLLALKLTDWELVFLRGNHEQAFLDFLEDPASYRAWRGYGAPETLLSYGVRPPRFDGDKDFVAARDELLLKCPVAHIDFFKSLRYMYEEGDYLFVHAGIRPGVALHRQSERDLLWIRDEFLEFEGLTDRVIIHGHTPSERPVRKANRLCLDTGAYITGRLTAVVLEGDEGSFLSATLSEQLNAA
jgi:serine/threonine protein phosphatase 1